MQRKSPCLNVVIVNLIKKIILINTSCIVLPYPWVNDNPSGRHFHTNIKVKLAFITDVINVIVLKFTLPEIVVSIIVDETTNNP